MAGPLDVAFSGADLSVRDPLIALPRTAGERFDAEWQAAMAPDRYFRQSDALGSMWETLVDEHYSLTGERLENPYAKTLLGKDGTVYPDFMSARAKRLQAARERIAEAKRFGIEYKSDPDLFERSIAEEAKRRRGVAGRYVDTGNGLAAFGGNVAGETVTPHGILSLFAPPTRLMTIPAQGAMRSFMGSIGREAFVQAQVGMGTQALGELLDYSARAPLGTQQTAGEVVQNILGAAVGGAVIGGGFRGLHEAWRLLRPEVRAAAPSAVRDAALTVERSVLDEGTNPLPPQMAAVHEQALERAQSAVLQGRAADVAPVVAYHGTPHAFERFDISKIGTGEGAQSWGWGLYFGGAREVAEHYRRQLSGEGSTPANDVASYWLKEAEGDYKRAAFMLRKYLAETGQPESGSDALKVLDSGGSGRTFHVELPGDESRYVLWDRPMSEQPEAVRAAFAKHGIGAEAAEGVSTAGSGTGGAAYEALAMQLGAATRAPGASFDRWKGNPMAASRALADEGIVGIKYLDQVSRDVGEGSHNYVIFDDKMVRPLGFEEAGQFTRLNDPTPIPSREQVNAMVKAMDSPEATKALDNQIQQMLEADPERSILISTDGENVRSVKIKDLLEEAKAGEKDAQAILSCAIGGAI